MAKVCFVSCCDGIDGSPRWDASRSAQLRLLQQGVASDYPAELLRSVVAGNDARKAAKAHTVAARKNNSPSACVGVRLLSLRF